MAWWHRRRKSRDATATTEQHVANKSPGEKATAGVIAPYNRRVIGSNSCPPHRGGGGDPPMWNEALFRWFGFTHRGPTTMRPRLVVKVVTASVARFRLGGSWCLAFRLRRLPRESPSRAPICRALVRTEDPVMHARRRSSPNLFRSSSVAPRVNDDAPLGSPSRPRLRTRRRGRSWACSSRGVSVVPPA